jgi:hypothetical protein|tara:strand:+ start:376 stop:960 length:585 start_codon:yes stop_codon:yes gene_type:complete
MFKNTNISAQLLIFSLSIMNICSANETANLGVHVHGLASIRLAIEKNNVVMELQSPSINFLGFERKPKKKSEIDHINRVESILKSARIYKFTGTNCNLIESDFELQTINSNKLPTESHDHSHGHDHETDDLENSHREIMVYHKFICGNTKTLKALDVFLFDEFPQVEKINAEWVSESKQGKTSLTRKNFKINLD